MTERRYPLGRLMEAAQIPTMVALRRVFPMNGTEYRRVIDEGLTEWKAERWAVRLRLLPEEVWPDWGKVPCALDDCPAMFTPHRDGHIYHDRRCARKAWARSPKGKASLAAAKTRWMETAGDYARRRDREQKRRARAQAREAA